jgi:succinate dehydrogenase/fumarate reductase cytochrome b subunit
MTQVNSTPLPTTRSSLDNLLATIQSGTGLAFSSFLSLHLFNHALCAFSLDLANSALMGFRVYYQHSAVEVGMVVAVIGHMGSSAARMFIRWKRHAALAERKKKDELDLTEDAQSPVATTPMKGQSDDDLSTVKEEKTEPLNQANSSTHVASWFSPIRQRQLFRLSGYILSFFIVPHVVATRLIPLWKLGDSSLIDYTLITHSALHYGRLLFYPYYAVFGLAGFYHLTLGAKEAWNRVGAKGTRVKVYSRNILRTGTGMFLVVGGAVLLAAFFEACGGHGVIQIPMRHTYDELQRAMLELLPIKLSFLS